LIHVSQLANKFVSDAREVVKTGDIVKVKVLEVDLARKRISLTMKLDAPTGARSDRTDNAFKPAGRDQRDSRGGPREARGGGAPVRGAATPVESAMAAAFAKLQGKR
jgi:uncharacterized protein